MQTEISRRGILGLGIAGLVCVSPISALAARVTSGERVLSLCQKHTGEICSSVYWANGTYVREGLSEISTILRDHRSGETTAMDPQLLDLLYTLKHHAGTSQPIEVYSGYRSPSTNAALRRRSRGVARRSYHMYGKAVDIRIPGMSSGQLVRLARSFEQGGVGFYSRRPFVHIDTGPVRYWRR